MKENHTPSVQKNPLQFCRFVYIIHHSDTPASEEGVRAVSRDSVSVLLLNVGAGANNMNNHRRRAESESEVAEEAMMKKAILDKVAESNLPTKTILKSWPLQIYHIAGSSVSGRRNGRFMDSAPGHGLKMSRRTRRAGELIWREQRRDRPAHTLQCLAGSGRPHVRLLATISDTGAGGAKGTRETVGRAAEVLPPEKKRR